MTWTQTRLTLSAWVELALYERRIKRGGYGGIHRSLVKQRVATGCRKPQAAAALCDAVNLACCLFYKPIHCLARSVITVRLMRKHGIDACLVIAFRPSPFFAHAWVEVDGEIVNDSPAYREQLIVLYRQECGSEERKERR